MKKCLVTAAVTLGMSVGFSFASAPAQAEGGCITYGNSGGTLGQTGVCYGYAFNEPTGVPVGPVGTEQLCLGPLGCTPGTTVLPQREVQVPTLYGVCADARVADIILGGECVRP